MSKKRITLIVVLTILLIITGLYTTYAINVYEEETTPTEYDMALNFDLSGNLTKTLTVEAGKTKVFDIDLTNSYSDAVQYGVAYTLVSPTSLPSGVTIAESSRSKNSSVGQINASSTISTTIVVANESTESVTVSFSIINGYKNGGDLIVPTGKVLVDGTYDIGPVTATKKIIKLSNATACNAGGSGVCATSSIDGTDYRYRGAEVDNFVRFNNDLYRIIGVFDDNSHGVEGEYLIKLIMADSLTSTSWGAYNSSATSGTYSSFANDWTGSTTGVKANLNVLLNEYFYNKTNTLSTYGACGDWTYYYTGTKYRTNDCTKIVGYGIDSNYRSYIEDVTWYLYGYTGKGLSKQNFYLCERGSYDGCTSANSGEYDTSTTGKIGLMYISDYMYASGYYSSDDTKTGSSSYYGNQNWLYDGSEWMITPRSDSAYPAFSVLYLGYLNSFNTYIGYGVRPTFYLKSSVQISGGKGTIDDPYTLSM